MLVKGIEKSQYMKQYRELHKERMDLQSKVCILRNKHPDQVDKIKEIEDKLLLFPVKNAVYRSRLDKQSRLSYLKIHHPEKTEEIQKLQQELDSTKPPRQPKTTNTGRLPYAERMANQQSQAKKVFFQQCKRTQNYPLDPDGGYDIGGVYKIYEDGTIKLLVGKKVVE